MSKPRNRHRVHLLWILIMPMTGAGLLAVTASQLVSSQPARSGQSGSSNLQTERTLAARVSEQAMVETVRKLVGLGTRMYGTPSNHASAAWLAEQFRAAGLEVTIREDTARDWYQPDSWSVTASGMGGLKTAWPAIGAPSGEVSGPLSTEPGPGVVWITDSNPRPEQMEGCAAVLLDGRITASGWPGISRMRGGSWPIPVFNIGTQDSEALRARLGQGAPPTITVRLASRTGNDVAHTPVATLPGRDRSKYVLFCAHGDADSGGPGADDNASGAAIVLQIARAAAEAVKAGLIPQPAWDMRFAVWAGEINSTRQYLATMPEDPAVLQAVFNYDQSGFGSWRDALYVEPDDQETNRPLITLIRQAMADHLGEPGFPEHAASIKSQGGTDSYVFQPTRRREGSPDYPSVTIYNSAWDHEEVVDVTEGFPPLNWYPGEEPGKVTVDGDAFYHSAGDTPANTTDTEPFNMGWCARVGLISALRFMGG
ncbi:MAG: M28 family peptidase [Gemmatimonadetes bacterium]|nr:M28 family peptidase [Gemmatimonadota bacterium]